MKTLNFDTGIVTYSLNDKCEIHINPTDSTLAARLINLVDTLGETREAYAAEMENADAKNVFAIAEKFDKMMRKDIDEVLGAPVCDAVFGAMSVLALADGLPVFCNLIFAILDEIDEGWERESKKTSARMAKYTEKYRK